VLDRTILSAVACLQISFARLVSLSYHFSPVPSAPASAMPLFNKEGCFVLQNRPRERGQRLPALPLRGSEKWAGKVLASPELKKMTVSYENCSKKGCFRSFQWVK